jgi:hypothetical protein
LRGIEAELDGGLKGKQSEVSEQVADLLLAGVDDRPGGSGVDGGGHLQTKLFKVVEQLTRKGVRGHGRFGRHELLLVGRQAGRVPGLLTAVPLNVGAPE